MKQLGPWKKYIIAAAIVQSIIVILIGYVLFKSRDASKDVESSIYKTDTMGISFKLSAEQISTAKREQSI